MSVRITDEVMISDLTKHAAAQVPGVGWVVSWLPGWSLTRNQATTAMALAEVVALMQEEGRTRVVDHTHPLWRHIDAWAAELGLTGPDAMVRASDAPEELEVAAIATRQVDVARVTQPQGPAEGQVAAMSVKVTDAEIAGDATPHRANRGSRGRWFVSWLPGWPLSRDQAITAVMLAESAAKMQRDRPNKVFDNALVVWPWLNGWASELGMSGSTAVALVLAPPPADDPMDDPIGEPPELPEMPAFISQQWTEGGGHR